jgi:tetratricopeptide (TPR) repeat protein
MGASDPFEAGELGATLASNLLRSLALRETDTAFLLVKEALGFELFSCSFRSAAGKLSDSGSGRWLGGADPQAEYLYALLVDLAFRQLGIQRNAELSLLLMATALAAGEGETAESVAKDALNRSDETQDHNLVLRCHDTLGRISADRNDFDGAKDHFSAGSKAAREANRPAMEWDQRTNLVWCLQQLGDLVAALKAIDAAEVIARELAEPRCIAKTLLDRGNTELGLGNRVKAQVAFEQVLEVAEQGGEIEIQSDALGNLGNIAYAERRHEEAERWHRRSLAISQTLPDKKSEQFDRNNLALTLAAQGKTEEALEAQQEALKLAHLRKDSGSIARYSESVKRLEKFLGRYQPATEDPGSKPQAQPQPPLKEAPPAAAKRMDDLEKQVRELTNQGKRDSALRAVTEHLQRSPDDFKAYLLYGILLAASGKNEEAANQIETAIRMAPDSLDAHCRLVDIYTRMEMLPTLTARLAKDSLDDPFRAGPRLALSIIYARTQRFDEAIQQAQKGVALASGDELAFRVLAEAQMGQAHSLLLRHQWDEAWLAFQDGATTIGRLLNIESAQEGQWLTFAAQWFERFATESHRTNPPFAMTMDVREITILAHATRYYRRAQKKDPFRNTENDRDRVTHLIATLARPAEIILAADQLRSDGYAETAMAMLLLSIQMDPDQPEAYFQLAQTFYALNGDTAAATETIQRALALSPGNKKYIEAQKFFLSKPHESAPHKEEE